MNKLCTNPHNPSASRSQRIALNQYITSQEMSGGPVVIAACSHKGALQFVYIVYIVNLYRKSSVYPCLSLSSSQSLPYSSNTR